jgi:hypothetical protein
MVVSDPREDRCARVLVDRMEHQHTRIWRPTFAKSNEP